MRVYVYTSCTENRGRNREAEIHRAKVSRKCRMVIVDTRLRFREKPTMKFHRVQLKSNENEVYAAS